ncbi:Velvet complex subunit B like [Actinidia chinensis var. chinensis]|uniref:Velvet complex subunit B like n=1 Tax=Actinidia chinensis var. chinensis TaxID=1590841 RepID=A0A2R6P893_ACTCC|nr:Velvet complex subunit B like [Actinidia chinensis var. chinensis]
MLIEVSLTDILTKVAMFVLVQALVYLILSNSSDIFSSKGNLRSISFKLPRSASIRRLLDAVSDLPQGGEASPMAYGSLSSPNKKFPNTTNDY